MYTFTQLEYKYESESERSLYYVSYFTRTGERMENPYSESFGYVTYDIVDADHMKLRNGKRIKRAPRCHISNLHIHPQYRGNGWSNFLLNAVFRTGGAYGVDRIVLEDYSDRYREDKNVYVNNGFKYASDDYSSHKMVLYR